MYPRSPRRICLRSVCNTALSVALALVLLYEPASGADSSPQEAVGNDLASTPNSEESETSGVDRDTSPLVYQGGEVTSGPRLYLFYWGRPWLGLRPGVDNFTIVTSRRSYTEGQTKNYITTFLKDLGQSAYNNIATQYCMAVEIPIGRPTCVISSVGDSRRVAETLITNPRDLLADTRIWIDADSPQPRPEMGDPDVLGSVDASGRLRGDGELGRAVARAGWPNKATSIFVIVTPPGRSYLPFGCSWARDWGGYKAIYLPVDPVVFGCGANAVTPPGEDTPFGNGIFDGLSIELGKRVAQVETNPRTFYRGEYRPGWLDSARRDINEKCLVGEVAHNITLVNNYFALRPLWSNRGAGLFSDPEGCMFVARSTASLESDADPLQFGSVFYPGERVKTVKIVNGSDVELHTDGPTPLRPDDHAFQLAGASPQHFAIENPSACDHQPLQRKPQGWPTPPLPTGYRYYCEVRVKFKPTTEEPRPVSATLEVWTDGLPNPARLGLLGTPLPRRSASPSPSPVDFGRRYTGTPYTGGLRWVNVRSTGSEPLRVGTPTTSSDQFRVVRNGCTGPVAPTASCVIDMRFLPTGATGFRSATLTIPHDGYGERETVELTGSAMEGSEPVTWVRFSGESRFGGSTCGSPERPCDLELPGFH